MARVRETNDNGGQWQEGAPWYEFLESQKALSGFGTVAIVD
jgi:hypothetical protein